MLLWTLPLVLCSSAAPEWILPAGKTPPSECRRIVSLAPSFTEILFALGEGARVAAVTRYDNWPEAAKALPRVGGLLDPDLEAMLSARPDCVLATPAGGLPERLAAVVGLGPAVLILPAESLEHLWQAIDTLGRLVGARAAAERLSTQVKDELGGIRRRSDRDRPLRVLVTVGYRPLIAAGPGSFLDTLLAQTNSQNVLTRGGRFVQLDLEAVLAAAPDVIVDATCNEAVPPGFWDRVIALSKPAPRLIALRDDSLLRPGPRLGEGLRALALALRPESKQP